MYFDNKFLEVKCESSGQVIVNVRVNRRDTNYVMVGQLTAQIIVDIRPVNGPLGETTIELNRAHDAAELVELAGFMQAINRVVKPHRVGARNACDFAFADSGSDDFDYTERRKMYRKSLARWTEGAFAHVSNLVSDMKLGTL